VLIKNIIIAAHQRKETITRPVHAIVYKITKVRLQKLENNIAVNTA